MFSLFFITPPEYFVFRLRVCSINNARHMTSKIASYCESKISMEY